MNEQEKLNLSTLIKLYFGLELNESEKNHIFTIFGNALVQDLQFMADKYSKEEIQEFVKGFGLKPLSVEVLLKIVNDFNYVN